MIEFTITRTCKKDNTYDVFSFNNFDDVINKIINDNNINLELMQHYIKTNIANAILNEGQYEYCIDNYIYVIKAKIK